MRINAIAGAVTAMAMLAGTATAQDNTLYFSPELAAEFTAPSAFEGLYAGVLLGAISARNNNFNTGGADIRGELGAIVGWNQPVAPGVVLGAELQATAATDLSTTYMRAMAIARLGFAAGDNTLIYMLGGAGRMGESWAFEAGLGAEVMVTGNMALRLEAAGIGQLGPVPNGNDIPAISAMRISSGAIWQLDGAPAANTGFNSGPVTQFSGAYAGLNFGSLADPRFTFYRDYGWGWHMSRFELGAMGGYNYALNDTFRVGVEGQIGANFDTSGNAGFDALALARVGVVPMEGVLAYAAAGAGVIERHAAYAFGGGAEYALWGQTSLRAEALVVGRFDGYDRNAHDRLVTTKATIGMVWHFD